LFSPSGAYIFNRLTSFMRAQYPTYGFREVVTPTIYKKSLWKVSGHWDNYAEDMFEVRGRGFTGTKAEAEAGEDEEFGLKPMNCPGHCLLFASEKHSYRDLPIRYADFSALHRNEISGALTGLTRVRRFHQDDGHIFCRPAQILPEIRDTLRFVKMVYGTFGLGPYKLVLSTRPQDHYIGAVEEWDRAEQQLKNALDESGEEWSISPHDGAFYGPKIDIILQDPTNPVKQHQTATIQLDFQLPMRFGLSYTVPSSAAEKNQASTGSSSNSPSSPEPSSAPATETPVLIHRAILGSLERFMALLLSHSPNHTLPFWLNPLPLVILPLNTSPELLRYCESVRLFLSSGASTFPPITTTTNNNSNSNNDSSAAATATAMAAHLDSPRPLSALDLPVAVDASARSLGKKKKEAFRKGYAFVAVVGEAERESRSVAVEMLRCTPRSEEGVAALMGEFASSSSAAAGAAGAEGGRKDGVVGVKAKMTVEAARGFLTRMVDGYL
jgi:threonyl-tRNA synthetase